MYIFIILCFITSIVFLGILLYLNFITIAIYFIISIALSLILLSFDKERNKYWIPGIWTAIGILGTFISLNLNIYRITDQTFNDVVLMTQFIKDFSSAFTTSIIGIIGSLIAKIGIKISEKDDLKKLKKDKSPDLQSEQYFLNKIVEYQEKQQSKEDLESWQTSVVKAIENLETKLVAELQDGDITTKLNRIRADTNSIKNNFELSAEQLVKNLSETLSPIMEQIGTTSFNKIEDMLSNMDTQLGKKMESILENMDTNLTNAIGKLVSTLQEETSGINQQLLGGINDLVIELKTHLDSIQETNSNLNEGVKALLETLQGEISKQDEQLQSINTKQKENYTNMIELYDNWQENIKSTNASIAADHETNIGLMQTSYEEKMSAILTGVSKDFGNLEEILSQLGKWQKENKKFVDETTNKFDESVTHFSDYMRVSSQKESEISNLTESIQNLKENIDTILQQHIDLISEYKNQHEHVLSISDLLNNMKNLKDLLDHLKTFK